MGPPKPREPARIVDLEQLELFFRGDVVLMLTELHKAGLPLVVFETRRSVERQRWLFAEGVTKALSKGPHVYGLAIDIVLDAQHAYWADKPTRPTRVGRSGAPWDTGVEIVERKPTVVRPDVAHVVTELGAAAKRRGLEWGGDITIPSWVGRRDDPFGWDPFHVQRQHWQGHESVKRSKS